MYLSRLQSQRFWNVKKKLSKYVVVPKAGMYKKDKSIPLLIVIRDILKFADNAREAKKIIKEGNVLIDKKVRKDYRFAVGLMNVIEFPKIKKYYRVVPGKNGLNIIEIDAKSAKTKLCKIVCKRNVRGGMFQLSLHDGRNILVKNGKKYKTHDSLLIEIPTQSIINHIKFEKGVKAFVIDGKNVGVSGNIQHIVKRNKMMEVSIVKIKTEKGVIEVPREYVMVGDYEQ